jgi:hypothetical protein
MELTRRWLAAIAPCPPAPAVPVLVLEEPVAPPPLVVLLPVALPPVGLPLELIPEALPPATVPFTSTRWPTWFFSSESLPSSM